MAYLRKQKSLQKLRLSAKVFENKFCQVVKKKIIKRLRFVFALFGFAEAAKFRDSGEFSEFRSKCLGKSNQRNFAQREKT